MEGGSHENIVDDVRIAIFRDGGNDIPRSQLKDRVEMRREIRQGSEFLVAFHDGGDY